MSDVDNNDLQLVLMVLFPETLLTTIEKTMQAIDHALVEVLDIVFANELFSA